jgi:hypothetical protein
MAKISGNPATQIRVKAELSNNGPVAMMGLCCRAEMLARALANMADYVLFLETRLTRLEAIHGPDAGGDDDTAKRTFGIGRTKCLDCGAENEISRYESGAL